MTVFDLEESPGVWFEAPGGGRVQIRKPTQATLKAIQRQTDKKRVEYKRIEGRAERLEWTERDEELHSALFWDYVIMAWEGAPYLCDREHKIRLLDQSPAFGKFLGECLAKLNADESARAEELAGN